LVLVAALAVVFWVAMPAMALNLPGTAPQPYKATFDDFSALYAPPATGAAAYTPLGPRLGPAGIAAGVDLYEQRTIFRINSLQDALNNFDSYYNTGTEELTGVIYDLKLVGVTAVAGSTTHFVLDFAPLGRNPLTTDTFKRDVSTLPGGDSAGGVGEVYLGTGATKNFTANPGGDANTGSTGLPASPTPAFLDAVNNGPAQWAQGAAGHAAGGAGADSYSTVTDGTQVLAFQFLPLSYCILQGLAIPDASVPLTPGTVFREDIDAASGVGSGAAYANVAFASGPFTDLVGDFDGIAFLDLTMRFNLRSLIFQSDPTLPNFGKIISNPDYLGPGEWAIESQDPVRFGIAVPEPATLTLLGLGLAGIGRLRLRRRK
jgi:hypothetical protein